MNWDLITVIPYVSDEQADAATKNPQLKLVFRLLAFYILDEGERMRNKIHTGFLVLKRWQ
jgi:replication fork protection complex subunit Tof1/Swi1